MHNPKLRVYLFAVLMFRTYLEHFDGINEMHIRLENMDATLIFWCLTISF